MQNPRIETCPVDVGAPGAGITIIGGGLSGLFLGVQLARQSVRVRVIDSGSYPRHRVCGEFICGRGLRLLADSGLTASLIDSGALWCDTVSFFCGKRSTGYRPLGEKALCVSRHLLDHLLVQCLQDAGGDFQSSTRYAGDFSSPGIIRATGRIPTPDSVSGERWLGLKGHLVNADPVAGLQMHRVPSGYVGVNSVEKGRVNVCGLFNLHDTDLPRKNLHQHLLCGEVGSALHALTQSGSWDTGSLTSVAGFSLKPLQNQKNSRFSTSCQSGEFRLGDAYTMIPPFTGNGMSMALESASLAVDPILAWQSGRLDWREAVHLHESECRRRFSRRLSCARQLHRLMFVPNIGSRLFVDLPSISPVRQMLFRLTR